LENPDFDGLLKWASERQKNIPNKYCLLIQNRDTLNYRPLVRLKYGADYQDLAPYLNYLLEDSPSKKYSHLLSLTEPGAIRLILLLPGMSRKWSPVSEFKAYGR
jgi:hypothetical protein